MATNIGSVVLRISLPIVTLQVFFSLSRLFIADFSICQKKKDYFRNITTSQVEQAGSNSASTNSLLVTVEIGSLHFKLLLRVGAIKA